MKTNPKGFQHVSLFSGIGGFDLAMEQAGVHTVASCEVDKFARGVLHDRFPKTHIFEDVKDVTADGLKSLGLKPETTILSAGFPCQDLSVAGSRQGMVEGSGTRSALFWEIDRILDEFRPQWVILENVPGLLSSRGGRDMGTVVGALAQRGYGFAYRILDAQHFGVPQARRRVFIVANLGSDGREPVQVLFEPEGLRGDPTTNCKPWQSYSRAAADSPSTDGSQAPRVEAKNVVPFAMRGRDDGNMPEVRKDPRVVSGIGASSDRSTRDMLAVPLAIAGNTGADGHMPVSQICPTLISDQQHSVIDEKLPGAEPDYVADVASTIMASGGNRGYRIDAEGAAGGHLLSFTENQRSEVVTREVFGALTTGGVKPGQGYPALLDTYTVRRLTPTECMRLQGFPDGHNFTYYGKATSDSQRYKQAGNAVAVPVAYWIAARLLATANHGLGVMGEQTGLGHAA